MDDIRAQPTIDGVDTVPLRKRRLQARTSHIVAATPLTLQELKKLLVARGFEIYRTLPASVALVERVRENLILDSGIRVSVTPTGFKVRVIFRAEGRGFPGETEDQRLGRAQALSNQATVDGFWALDQQVVPQMDPSHPDVELDRFYEVACEREVHSLDDVEPILRKAFEWLRSVPAA